jgi:hypothetical protein
MYLGPITYPGPLTDLGPFMRVIRMIFIKAVTSWASLKTGSLCVPAAGATDITTERKTNWKRVTRPVSSGLPIIKGRNGPIIDHRPGENDIRRLVKGGAHRAVAGRSASSDAEHADQGVGFVCRLRLARPAPSRRRHILWQCPPTRRSRHTVP